MLKFETPRLILRDFQSTDWKHVHEYACDLEVVRFMEWGPNTPEETIKFVDGTINCAIEQPRRIYELAVIERSQEKLIGACGLRINDNDWLQAEIGYCYNRLAWGKGYATEAALRLLEFGFETLDMHRIRASCDAENLGSAAVLTKAGLRREGHAISDRKVRDKWRNSYYFAILREEWKK